MATLKPPTEQDIQLPPQTPKELSIIEAMRKAGFEPVAVRLNEANADLNVVKGWGVERDYGRAGKGAQYYELGNHEVKVTAGGGNNTIVLTNAHVRQVTTGNGNNKVIINGELIATDTNAATIKLGSGNDTIILGTGASVELPYEVANTDAMGRRTRNSYTTGSSYIDGGKGIDKIVFPAGVTLSDVKPTTWSIGTGEGVVNFPALQTPNGLLKLQNVEQAEIGSITYNIGMSRDGSRTTLNRTANR